MILNIKSRLSSAWKVYHDMDPLPPRALGFMFWLMVLITPASVPPKLPILQMLSYVFMVFLTASLFFQDSAQMALCFSLLPLLGSTTKNMLYYNRVSLFTSQTENKHLESKAIPSLSLHSSFQLSGSLIIFVEWVKNLYGNNIIPLGEITLKNVFINNKYWAFPVR